MNIGLTEREEVIADLYSASWRLEPGPNLAAVTGAIQFLEAQSHQSAEPSRECLQQSEALHIAMHLRQRAKLSRPGNLDTLSAAAANELERLHARIIELQAAPPAQTSENLRCKSVQKRLATMWGFVPAQAQAPAGVAVPDGYALVSTDATQLAGHVGYKVGRVTVKSGRVQSFAFEQSDTPDGGHYLYASVPAQSQQDALDARLYRHLREYASMSYPSGEGSSSKEAYLVVTGYGNVADPSIIDEAVKDEIAAKGASNV